MSIATGLGCASTGQRENIGQGGCLGFNGKNGNTKSDVDNCFAKFKKAPATHFVHRFYETGFNWGTSSDVDKAMQERYLVYIMNESPWAIHHKYKTIKDLKKFGAWIDVRLTGHEIMQACSAMRLCQERDTFIRLWDKMVGVGVHPNIAFLLSYSSHVLFQAFSADSNNVLKGKADLGDHEVLDIINLKTTGVYAFINKEIVANTHDRQPYGEVHTYNQHIVECMTGRGNKHFVSYVNKRFLKPLAITKRSKGLRGVQVKITRAVSNGMLIGVGCQLTAELNLFKCFTGFEV
jgi:hypothetical protein